MKKLLLITLLFFASKAYSQAIYLTQPYYNFHHVYTNLCSIHFTYDNAGNRTARYYECGSNPFYIPLTSTGGGGNGGSGGGGISKPGDAAAQDANIIVFPNPTQGVFYVQVPDGVTSYLVEVKSLEGKRIYSELVTEPNKGISIGTLANGQYLISVTIDEKTKLVKLLKQD
jgi:hypothetical protein